MKLSEKLVHIVYVSIFYINVFVNANSLTNHGNSEQTRLNTVKQGVKWLLERRNTEWGWGERQEAEAIIALQLANDTWFHQMDPDSHISVKQMNIDLLAAITLDNSLNSTQWSRGKLAVYICGLKSTCQNPRNFYGHDLIKTLEAHMDNFARYFQANKFAFSWTVLALCNSNVTVKDKYVFKLMENAGEYKFGVDEASMVLMALSCIHTPVVRPAKTAAENYILKHQASSDGSFGNQYTTGLAIQALTASGRTGIEKIIEKATGALINMQASEDTSINSVAAANQVLPALAKKSFVDIGKIPCVVSSRPKTVKQGVQWLLERRNTEWGWGERQEAEAIIALQLANDTWFNKMDPDSYISVKQMNIVLLAAISLDKSLNSAQWAIGRLGVYICGLKSTCQNPRNFYGHDLINTLEEHMDNFQANKFAFSWGVLALCNSNETVKDKYVSKLMQKPGEYKLGVDEASMVLMALSCIDTPVVRTAKTAAENYILNRQNSCQGSFGNHTSTGLAIQALKASGRTGIEKKIKKATEALINMQASEDTRISSVEEANHILPALANKSFVDIKKIPCVVLTTTSTTTSGPFMNITITVEDPLRNRINRTWSVGVSSNGTLFDALVYLENQNKGFSFTRESTSWGYSIKSINGIFTSTEDRTYWSLLIAPDTPSTTGVSSTRLDNNDHYIFRMATW